MSDERIERVLARAVCKNCRRPLVYRLMLWHIQWRHEAGLEMSCRIQADPDPTTIVNTTSPSTEGGSE